MDWSKGLVPSTDWALNEIVAECGLTNQPHFTRLFRVPQHGDEPARTCVSPPLARVGVRSTPGPASASRQRARAVNPSGGLRASARRFAHIDGQPPAPRDGGECRPRVAPQQNSVRPFACPGLIGEMMKSALSNCTPRFAIRLECNREKRIGGTERISVLRRHIENRLSRFVSFLA
jgi:hypothetical protein